MIKSEKLWAILTIIIFMFFCYAMFLFIMGVNEMKQCKSMGYNIYNYYEHKCVKIDFN